MKAINGLLVSLIAGSCATAALAAGQDDVTKALGFKKMDRLAYGGTLGGSGGFGTRFGTLQMDVYSNVDLGPNRYLFVGYSAANASLINTCGEHIFLQKGGYSNFTGYIVGYDANTLDLQGAAGTAKLNEMEFWLIASDTTLATGVNIGCAPTFEMFQTCVDWMPAGSTCAPSGNDSVCQISLGGFGYDLSGTFGPFNGFVTQYIGDLQPLYGPGYINWNIVDGDCFLDHRIFADTTFAALQPLVGVAFDGHGAGCGLVNVGTYPALGFSQDNFYYDNNLNGIYTRLERFFFGAGQPCANLMIRFGSDEGCTADPDGNGFINGDDVGYINAAAPTGCPY